MNSKIEPTKCESCAEVRGEVSMWKRSNERYRDQIQAWRNWSDEVATPFGSSRDRSDAGQRDAIKHQLATMTSALERALRLCDVPERDQDDAWQEERAALSRLLP